jgi:oligopeptide/dipeptide ABC transporter ATP-binding protein
MTASDPILSVDQLFVAYETNSELFSRKPPFVAVSDVSFSINAGETFGLVGESGSGKTSIGRAVLRLAPITAGAIRFEGTDINNFGKSTPLSFRRAVQMIFQDPQSSLNPRHTVAKILGQVVARHRSVSRAEQRVVVEELLDAVQLAGYLADRHPSELSGGQRQRVAIAHALATEPSLIVCDEAVSALDVSTQSEILNLLQDLQAQFGLSYLFISHDLAVVRHVSNRIAVMYRGRLVEVGATKNIYQAPRHPYTQTLLASVPIPNPQGRQERRNKRQALHSSNDQSLSTSSGCAFQSRCPIVLPICKHEVPTLRRLSNNHQIACHATDGSGN